MHTIECDLIHPDLFVNPLHLFFLLINDLPLLLEVMETGNVTLHLLGPLVLLHELFHGDSCFVLIRVLIHLGSYAKLVELGNFLDVVRGLCGGQVFPACLESDLLLVVELVIVFFLLHLEVKESLVLAVSLPLLLSNVDLVLLHRALIRNHVIHHSRVLVLHFPHLNRKSLKSLLLDVLLAQAWRHLLIFHFEVFASW